MDPNAARANDDAYANAAHIAGAADYPPRWRARAEAFRAQAGGEIGVSYGPGPRQAYDLFLPRGAMKDGPRGTVIFVHGGYWRAFDRSTWSHLAAGPLSRGWAVAMPGYDLCPEVRVSEITRQIAAATAAIAARMPGPLVLTGHSAGGHLVARMGCPDVDLPGDVRAAITRIVPISPLADLEPLIETTMNDDLRLDRTEARAESPLHHPRPGAEVTVWVGGAERPAFLDQARWLAGAWDCACEVDPGRHHFDVIDALEDGASPLVERLVGDRAG